MSWATDHALSSTAVFTYNNVVYYPYTTWTISNGITTGSGSTWLRAAVRFLIGADSTSNSNHILAQYSAYSNDGSTHSNGYMLIRKLNSSITSYTNDAGTKTQGSFYSTLNTNQRQGYVYNAVLSGNFMWIDTPYFVTDCGSNLENNTSITSKAFYVGTTEVVSGVYQQTYVVGTCTTPIVTSVGSNNKVIVNGETLMDISSDTVAADKMLSGYTAHDKNGDPITGEIATATLPTSTSSSSSGTSKATLNVSTSDRYINIPAGYVVGAGYYLVRGVTTANISAENIKSGVTVTVGDSASAGRIKNIAGTYTNVSSGQTALTASVLRSGYSGFANGGSEVKGTMGLISVGTSITGTTTVKPSISRSAVGITGVTDAASGAATTTAPSSGVYVKVSSAANTGTLTATPSASTAGYGSSTEGTFTAATATVGASASDATYVPITTMTLPTSAVTTNPSVTNMATLNRSTSTRYIKIPVGYNSAEAQYTISSVANGSATTPTATITTNPTITASGGNIIASYSGSSSITPTVSAGYVSSGTAGTVSTSGSATVAATTLDANLSAENIADGITIFGVTGTHSGGSSGVTCTARSGGGSWQNAINASGTTVGWREEKFSDGRLTRWCWDYWNANAGDGNKTVAMTANASDGSGPTAFVGTPQFAFGFINNNTTIACNATVKSWSNSSVTYYLVFTNNTSGRRIAVSLKMEGRWQ